MYIKSIMLLPILSMMTAGCASIVSGTDQDIAIHSNPEGAECILTREGQMLRKVTTPNTVRIKKLKHDIYLKCNMDEFHESTAHVNSGTQGSTFGNILLGGGIGWAFDSARGADNKYADVVTVTMVPKSQAVPAVVMIDADGNVLTPEQVKELKEKQAKAQETDLEKAEKAEETEVAKEAALPHMPEEPEKTTLPVTPEKSEETQPKISPEEVPEPN